MARPLALVTGGHRRLGAYIAAALVRGGYGVAIHGSHDAEPEPWLADVLASEGAEWRGFVADFTDPSQAERLIGQVAAHFGRAPVLLVNSASIFGQDRLDDVTPDDLARHFAVNASAPVLLTKAFAAATAGEEGGDRSIVNILDQRLTHPHRDQLAYTLSKFALAGLTQTAARVLAPAVRVNAVAPGLTLATPDYVAGDEAELAAHMPLGRLPLPEQVADAVLFLARATATTGQILHVDGGAGMVAFDADFLKLL